MIPPTVWMFWEDGFDGAPPMVKQCLNRWRESSSGLNFQLLEGDAIEEFLPEYKNRDMTIQAKSDVLRMRVISRYGGIWADASTFPRVDIVKWLHSMKPTDFLAFSYSNSEFLLSSWFLAAPKGSYIMSEWAKKTDDYWTNDRRLEASPRQRWRFKKRLLRQANFLDASYNEMHPYFWLHYLFGDLVMRDAKACEIWLETDTPSSEAAHFLQHELKKFGTERSINLRKSWMASPIHKLDWRMSIDEQFLETLGN